ncbi:hypothetical protein SALBM311S_10472 [Streptomyces alboniger]
MSDRNRCRAARIPDEREFATKGDLAKAMVRRVLASPLPVAWVTADSAYGQEWRLRRMLEEAGASYVLAVPKSQHVHALGRIDFAIAQAPDDAWERHSCGNGAKGPRIYDWAAARLPAIDDFDGDQPTHQRSGPGPPQPGPSGRGRLLPRLRTQRHPRRRTRALAGSRWAIEEAFQAAKNECGLDQYEVRRYPGWYRHITLAMLAHPFLRRHGLSGSRKRGRQKRFRRSRAAHRGRNPTAPGSWPSPGDTLAAHRPRIELVALAQAPPAQRPAASKVTNFHNLTWRQPSTLRNTALTSSDSELRLEY